ncbi:MAG: PKD domain-containing protein [Bacteroidota bacterium]
MFSLTRFTLFSVLIFVASAVNAQGGSTIETLIDDIMGVELYYECDDILDEDDVRAYYIMMDVYFDCSEYGTGSVNGLFEGFDVLFNRFDGSEVVTIYGAADESPIEFSFFDRPKVERITVENLGQCSEFTGDDPCIVKATYRGWIKLPIIDESYYVVYQKCCRSFNVDNIRQSNGIRSFADTNDAVGGTYYTKIKPAAQRLCNTSAQFKNLPPFYLCINEEFTLKSGVVDNDGDSLSYEFYAPFVGHGYQFILQNDGIFFVSHEDTVLVGSFGFHIAPTADLPPPYSTVEYLPGYSDVDHPLGFASTFELDKETGQLSGTPRLWGEFLVGILVKEHRNGEVISESRRDFYINTIPCLPSVVSYINNADSTYLQEKFFMGACNGDTTVFFDNQSFNRISVDETLWEFYFEEDTLRSSEWDIEVDFPGAGMYEGILASYSNDGCNDTVSVFVRIEDPIEPDFSIVSDTCSAEPIQFTDLTTPNPFLMEKWTWNFGDSDSSKVQNPTHAYATIGDYEVSLRVGTQYCDTIITQPISYYPAPTIASILPDTAIFCGPSEAQFSYLSQPSSDAYETRWIFAPIDTVFTTEATYFYDSVGVFDVRLQITSPNGCQTDSLLQDLVTVLPPLKADFLIEFDSCVLDSIRFIDLSEADGAMPTTWIWQFGDSNTSEVQNPNHLYDSAGEKQISLNVRLGQCEAEVQRSISYFPVPDSVSISPMAATYCGGQDVLFQLVNSFALTDDYDIIWDLGGGKIESGRNITTTYETSGIYDIEVSLNAPNGCATFGQFDN